MGLTVPSFCGNVETIVTARLVPRSREIRRVCAAGQDNGSFRRKDYPRRHFEHA